MVEFLPAPFLVQHFSNYTLMTFLMMLFVILLLILMTLLYSKFNQLSDMWQQPVSSTFELESDLQVTVD